ncbi:MAG: pilus assembly protein TadG-related protein, partial [Hyphomicrobium sp.]
MTFPNKTFASRPPWRDDAGTVSLIFGMVALVLFSFIGAAVDYGRWSNANARTVDALDAALLAAGRALQSSQSEQDALAVAEKMFLENANSRLQLKSPKVTVAIVDGGMALEANATGKIVTPFMGLMNFATLTVNAHSKVGFSVGAGSSQGGSDLEISMMLDVTGSMCADGEGPCNSSSKLDALKSASSDLVNIILK